MNTEDKIRKVKQAVEEAIHLIHEKHSGANLDEARKYLSQAGVALKEDDFEEAIELATKAQLTARPTTDYLLSKARELAVNAEKNFDSKNYEEAIMFWNRCKEEYVRAGDLARERKEQEIVDRLTQIQGTIKDNILNSEISIENREMHRSIYNGNSKIVDGNRLFENAKFEESRKVYQEALEAFNKAKSFAAKRNFAEEKIKIEGSLKSVESSIEACLLSKGNEILQNAHKCFEKKDFSDAEEAFSSALEYLKKLNVQRKKELEEMISTGEEGSIKAKLEQGKGKMRTADGLFKSNQYYEAKNAYKSARDYLEPVSEMAIKYKFSALIHELGGLVHACSQNIHSAAIASTDVGTVKPIIIPVEEVKTGIGSFIKDRKKGPTTSPPVTPGAKQISSKYASLDYLGGGGFADVYKATKKDGTIVAVKVLRNLDEKTEKIFFREIQTWEKMNHRNIARLIAPYLHPLPHIEIEYVENGSLYEALQSGVFNVNKASRIAYDIAYGLKYSHSKHVIHGDVNPKNVLLNRIGEAKLIDFGLSKITSSSTEVQGYTLAYASKETLEKKKVDEKTDAYQLGLTFYFMLTGINPFNAGSRYETEERIKNFTPDAPSKYNRECCVLDTIIMRSLSKNPDIRPSPGEFKEFIYNFMKKNYGESLHFTEDIHKILTISCSHAMMAAKNENIAECLSALNYAKGKVTDPQIREDMKKLIEQVEFRANNKISLEKLLDNMEIFLKKVEWEG